MPAEPRSRRSDSVATAGRDVSSQPISKQAALNRRNSAGVVPARLASEIASQLGCHQDQVVLIGPKYLGGQLPDPKRSLERILAGRT